MLILRGTKDWGILDNKANVMYIRGKKIELQKNILVSEGDVIELKKDRYDVLLFNPAFYQHVAERKAQIIQPADASYIISRAGIKEGSNVLESGIGTGALSSYILWAIGESGTLTGVDIDPEAAEVARRNLSKFFDLKNWVSRIGDIRNETGFGEMDAAVLAILDPWNAVSNVRKFLKTGGILATYSPTFNQTEKTVVEMKRQNMLVIETTEIIKRDLIVREESTRPDHNIIGHTAFLTFAMKRSNSEINL